MKGKTMVIAVLLCLPVQAAVPSSQGRATMSGEVLAAGCSIALADRDQTVSLGDQPLRTLGRDDGRRERVFHIRLDNCVPSGTADRRSGIDPAVRIRFDGLRSGGGLGFQPVGTSRGVALRLKDEYDQVLIPGVYSTAIFDRSHNQQQLNFTLELVPDGTPLQAGDYRAALRFNVDYE